MSRTRFDIAMDLMREDARACKRRMPRSCCSGQEENPSGKRRKGKKPPPIPNKLSVSPEAIARYEAAREREMRT